MHGSQQGPFPRDSILFDQSVEWKILSPHFVVRRRRIDDVIRFQLLDLFSTSVFTTVKFGETAQTYLRLRNRKQIHRKLLHHCALYLAQRERQGNDWPSSTIVLQDHLHNFLVRQNVWTTTFDDLSAHHCIYCWVVSGNNLDSTSNVADVNRLKAGCSSPEYRQKWKEF